MTFSLDLVAEVADEPLVMEELPEGAAFSAITSVISVVGHLRHRDRVPRHRRDAGLRSLRQLRRVRVLRQTLIRSAVTPGPGGHLDRKGTSWSTSVNARAYAPTSSCCGAWTTARWPSTGVPACTTA